MVGSFSEFSLAIVDLDPVCRHSHLDPVRRHSNLLSQLVHVSFGGVFFSVENLADKKFPRSSLKYERELMIIFKDVVAPGEDMFSLSFIQTQTEEAGQEDVYRLTMDENEGSGDCEDGLFGVNPLASTGVTDELVSTGL